MPKTTRRKIGLEIDSHLYAELGKLAAQNGQSRRFLLEQALKLYLQTIGPAPETVRPGVLEHYHKSAAKNRKLLQLLAR
jgi:metal-responsive CopG/Arc/MetJ family transcriptional regulator